MLELSVNGLDGLDLAAEMALAVSIERRQTFEDARRVLRALAAAEAEEQAGQPERVAAAAVVRQLAAPRPPFLFLLPMPEWGRQVSPSGEPCWVQMRGDDVYVRFPADALIPGDPSILVEGRFRRRHSLLREAGAVFALRCLNGAGALFRVQDLTADAFFAARAVRLGDDSPTVGIAGPPPSRPSEDEMRVRSLIDAYVADEPASFRTHMHRLYGLSEEAPREAASAWADLMAQALSAEIARSCGSNRNRLTAWGIDLLAAHPRCQRDLRPLLSTVLPPGSTTV
jgi:hypothetical protein